MLKNKAQSIEAVIKITRALGDLNEQVVFAGGSVAALYVDDPAAPEVRPTKDVDIIFEITSQVELEKLRQQLATRGIHVAREEKVMCRFTYHNILIDVMCTRAIGWAPSNPWFKSGYDNPEIKQLGDVRVKILPVVYYLASKFVAFRDRGGDPRTSTDFEDIVYILDNRQTIVEDIRESTEDVKTFLLSELKVILENESFREALMAHLEWRTQAERYEMLLQKLKVTLR